MSTVIQTYLGASNKPQDRILDASEVDTGKWDIDWKVVAVGVAAVAICVLATAALALIVINPAGLAAIGISAAALALTSKYLGAIIILSGLLALVSPFCMASRTYRKWAPTPELIPQYDNIAGDLKPDNSKLVEVRHYTSGPKEGSRQLHYETITA